jgi:hypothetical protein
VQTFSENGSNDLLKMVKRKSGVYKPLTMAEERELSGGVQDLFALCSMYKIERW